MPVRLMNADEYLNLERVEPTHWYYAGKRELVRSWIQRTRPPAPDDVLLDWGAGTGFFAKEMESCCRVLVLDNHEEALGMLRRRFAPGQVLALDDFGAAVADGSLAYVTVLDVLEHMADDAGAVRTFHRLLRPGGLAVVTVPAGMALWNDWDRALHHYRRYSRRQLRALFPAAQWELVHVNYTNVAVYPAVWVARRWLRRSGGDSEGVRLRAEDRLPPRWLNRLLRSVFVGFGRSRIPFPLGVSLLLVARRR